MIQNIQNIVNIVIRKRLRVFSPLSPFVNPDKKILENLEF